MTETMMTMDMAKSDTLKLVIGCPKCGHANSAFVSMSSMDVCVLNAYADRLETAKVKAADADKAKSDAQAAYDAAVKEANAKKVAADAAKLQIAKGSLGFFESRGSEDAVKVLTDPNTTKYLSSIELGKDVAFVGPEAEATIQQANGGLRGAFKKDE